MIYLKALVVDDEALIREVIKEYLENENIEVVEAEDGEKAVNIALKDDNINIIIMDIMMPKLDGYAAYKKIRESKDIPCIMLSAKAEEYDKLTGFNIGVDDYITKPFSPKELVARIKAIMKRVYFDDDTLEDEGIKIDNLAHEVYVDNKKIELTPKEYELLKYFMQNKNIALSRDNLLNHIWGYDFYGDCRTIDTHVKTLRNNLGKYRDKIKTVRALGYKFESKKEK